MLEKNMRLKGWVQGKQQTSSDAVMCIVPSSVGSREPLEASAGKIAPCSAMVLRRG